MYVILAFDVEDIYYLPKYRIDDIPGWLAEVMSQVGIRGTFFVMGEKAKKLKERGRTDILEKMAQHDIASHQQGNCYPLVPQVVEGQGWQDGIEAIRGYEDRVKEQLRAAFGKEPVAFSRHNNYFAPQHLAVAGERGLSYMYMIGQIPHSRQPLWYAGTLTFPSTGQNGFAGFDQIYSRDELFEAQLSKLDRSIQKCLTEKQEWFVVFACHPLMLMARGWLEHHLLTSGRSRTPPELGWHYGVKPREEEERAKANFKRLCLYLKQHPDLEVVGIEEAARLFSGQPTQIDRDALVEYASAIVKSQRIIFHRAFSPAELTCGFADSLVYHSQVGDLPEKVERRNVLGPTDRPVIAQEKNYIMHEEIVSVCRHLLGNVESNGHLPANLITNNERLGLAQIAILAAKSYLALAQYNKYERLAVPSIPLYPAVAFEMDTWIRQHIGEHWAMPLDFSCDVMAKHTRLQTWTMKPAWLRSPQGPVTDQEHAAKCFLSK